MRVVYGLSKTNPVDFVNFLLSKKLPLEIEPNTTQLERKQGYKKYVAFFDAHKAIVFLRQMAVKRCVHTLIVFAPYTQLEQMRVSILDIKPTRYELMLQKLLTNYNKKRPMEIPRLNKSTDIQDLIQKSKSETSFLQAYQSLYYSFQHAVQKQVKNNVLLYMAGKLPIEKFKQNMEDIKPKRGSTISRFDSLIELTLSTVGQTLRKAMAEVVNSKQPEEAVKSVAKKYKVSPFDLRYFYMLWSKGESKDAGVLGRIVKSPTEIVKPTRKNK